MALSFTVSKNTSGAGAACSATGATGSANDLIVAFESVGDALTVTIPAAPTGTITSWTAVNAGVLAGSGQSAIRAFYASAPGTGAVTVTMAAADGGIGLNMVAVYRIAAAAFDAAPAATTASATSCTTAATTGTNGGLAVACFAIYTGSQARTLTVGSGYTGDGQIGGTAGVYGCALGEHVNLTSTGTVSGASESCANSSSWAGQLVTVAPSSGGPVLNPPTIRRTRGMSAAVNRSYTY